MEIVIHRRIIHFLRIFFEIMKTPVDHNNLESHEEYFNHMQTITLKANLYRRFYLYPRLIKFLPNKTLDIGCGLGSFQNFKNNVIGIDINSTFIFFEPFGIPVYLEISGTRVLKKLIPV